MLACAAWLRAPAIAAFVCALPAASLLLGPGAPAPVAALAAAGTSLAALRSMTAPEKGSGHGPGSGRAAGGDVSRGLALLHGLAWALLVQHFYLATGHGAQFNSLHWAAPFVGWDAYAPVRGAALLMANSLAAQAGVAVLLAGPGGWPRGAPAAAASAGPAALAAAVTAAFCAAERRHLQAAALLAPKIAFDAAHALVAAVLAAMTMPS